MVFRQRDVWYIFGQTCSRFTTSLGRNLHVIKTNAANAKVEDKHQPMTGHCRYQCTLRTQFRYTVLKTTLNDKIQYENVSLSNAHHPYVLQVLCVRKICNTVTGPQQPSSYLCAVVECKMYNPQKRFNYRTDA